MSRTTQNMEGESKGLVHPDIPSIMGPACSLPCSSGPFDCVSVDQNKVDIQHLNCFSAPRGGQQIGNLGYDVRGWLCFMCSIWGYTTDVGGQVQQAVWGQADLSAGAAERDKKAKLCCGAPLLTPCLLCPSSAESKDNISFKMSPRRGSWSNVSWWHCHLHEQKKRSARLSNCSIFLVLFFCRGFIRGMRKRILAWDLELPGRRWPSSLHLIFLKSQVVCNVL